MVDNNLLDSIYRVINNTEMRNIIKIIGVNGAMSYSEILWNNRKKSKDSKSSKVAYYFRHLHKANMIKSDDATKKYILTRIGVQTLDLLADFEKICTSYDLSDCDADGTIEFQYKIKGRKL
jgi:hypothetical protein